LEPLSPNDPLGHPRRRGGSIPLPPYLRDGLQRGDPRNHSRSLFFPPQVRPDRDF